jgi:hypothetical protein
MGPISTLSGIPDRPVKPGDDLGKNLLFDQVKKKDPSRPLPRELFSQGEWRQDFHNRILPVHAASQA